MIVKPIIYLFITLVGSIFIYISSCYSGHGDTELTSMNCDTCLTIEDTSMIAIYRQEILCAIKNTEQKVNINHEHINHLDTVIARKYNLKIPDHRHKKEEKIEPKHSWLKSIFTKKSK